jgi:NAD+ diphosphatase
MIEMPFATPPTFETGVIPPAVLPESALWLIVRGSAVLVGEDELRVPTQPAVAGPLLRTQYLGRLGDDHVFSGEVPAETAAPAGWRWSELRPLFGSMSDSLFALAGRAVQIVDWDRTHLFCGRCGTATRARLNERSRECPQCGLLAYPRLAPALMALIRRGPDQILLARSPRFPPGMFSALAGFAEPGETLEQCLHREVLEEVGVRVKNLRYFASQPWPFPHSLMIAFICDYDSGEIRRAPEEIEDANWFRITSLPRLPAPISIARRLIDAGVAEMMSAASR